MPVLFNSHLPKRTVDSLHSALTRAVAMSPTVDPRVVVSLSNEVLGCNRGANQLIFGRLAIALAVPLLLAATGLLEFHLNAHELSAVFLSWSERTFTLLLGFFAGESLARES